MPSGQSNLKDKSLRRHRRSRLCKFERLWYLRRQGWCHHKFGSLSDWTDMKCRTGGKRTGFRNFADCTHLEPTCTIGPRTVTTLRFQLSRLRRNWCFRRKPTEWLPTRLWNSKYPPSCKCMWSHCPCSRNYHWRWKRRNPCKPRLKSPWVLKKWKYTRCFT
jgi:hypothetical protein